MNARGLLQIVGGAALLLLSCDTKVVQMASRPAEPLDCDAPVELELPTDPIWGDGSEEKSLFVGEGFARGEGPGLYVTARDAFRVYLTDRLVTESEVPRAAVFVPLTLTPGTNALTVVVAARSGTPTALVHLDELDESYVSSTSWKVSGAPEDGFRAADFDDSSWANATNYGAPDELGACSPESDEFPTNSAARWMGPVDDGARVVAFRRKIELRPVGFGAATTGGEGATPTIVSSFDELERLASGDEPALLLLPEGVHDFRDAPRDQEVCPAVCSQKPDKPFYTVLVGDQTCASDLETRTRTERRLTFGSNKTVVGLGRGAQVRGVTFEFRASNVIVRNLALYDVNSTLFEAGDAFTVSGAERVWLDHCTTKWISDGFIDASSGTEITLSWLHFDGISNNACDGQHIRTSQLSGVTATIHHCFFDHVTSLSPRIDASGAQVHFFDNLLADNPGYGVASTCGAEVLVEANTFQRVATPTSRSTCSDDTELGRIDAPAGSNLYDDDVGDHHGGDNLEPSDDVFTPPYEYELDDPRGAWLEVLSRAGAGGRWARPLEFD